MSTIVAVSKSGETVVAWDDVSTVSSTRCVNLVGRPKVRRVGDSLLGTTGLSVYLNLLDHYLERHDSVGLESETSIFDFFLNFWKELRSEYHLVNQVDDEAPSPFADLDAEFLVANRHGLFRVKEILSVGRYEKFCVIGSGSPHAEGALSVLYEQELSATEIAESALKVAAQYDPYTGEHACSLAVGRN